MSYFNLNKLEKIYKAYFNNNEELNLYEGILEATCCLIPERDIFESYKVLSSIYAGENGTGIFGRSSKDRILMLITMMKIYEKNHKIENLITYNFKNKSENYFNEYHHPLCVGSIYFLSEGGSLKVKKKRQKVKHPLKKIEVYLKLQLV